MTENQLITLIITAINNGLAALNLTGIGVKQRYQPTTQGTPSGPCIFLHNQGDQLYGYPHRSAVSSLISGQMTFSESQVYITTFQISALAINNPADTSAMTVGDLIKTAAYVLNSQATQSFLLDNGIQVDRITAIRKTHFKDDKERFEEDPTFDCGFVYCQVNQSTIPGTSKIIEGIYPV